MMAPQPIVPERLVDFAAALYSTLGVPDPEARLLADTLVGPISGDISRMAFAFELVREAIGVRRNESQDQSRLSWTRAPSRLSTGTTELVRYSRRWLLAMRFVAPRYTASPW